jgi:hypothetical protein
MAAAGIDYTAPVATAATGPSGDSYFNPNTINTALPQQLKAASSSTPYDTAQTSAIQKLYDIANNGGYTPAQINTFMTGTEAGLQPQIDAAKLAAKNDAYARGLGGSSVLSANYANIDKGKIASLAQALAGYTQQGAAMVPGAISAIQQGVSSNQNLALQYNQMQMDLEKQKNDFAQQIGMDRATSQRFYDQLAATVSMSNADREVAMRQLQQQYNLTEDQIAAAKEIADQQSATSFFSNLLGSGAALLLGTPTTPKPK